MGCNCVTVFQHIPSSQPNTKFAAQYQVRSPTWCNQPFKAYHMPQTCWIVKIHIEHYHMGIFVSIYLIHLEKPKPISNQCHGVRKVKNKKQAKYRRSLHHDSCIPNINAQIKSKTQCHTVTITLYPWQVVVDNGMSCFSQAVLTPQR